MKSIRFLDRRVGFSLASIGLLLGMVAPAVVPAFASAAQITSRSISLSTSAKDATDVSYEVKFTAAQAGANAFVLDFCNDSPIPGQTCTAPTGFDASGATVGSGAASVANTGNSTLTVTLSAATTAGGTVDVVLNGIKNPTVVTTSSIGFYARIVTYDTAEDAANYSDSDNGDGALDDGGVAMAITYGIGVSAAVRESLLFCVSHTEPDTGCSGTVDDPSVELGESSGAGVPKALSTSVVSNATDYAQISTNASHGAVVYLKNSNKCGGLERLGEDNYGTDSAVCDIAPADGNTFTQAAGGGSAYFGMLLGTAASAPSAANPTGTISTNAAYTGSSYNMVKSGSAATDDSGDSLIQDVTSTYGGYIFGTSQAPISDQDIPLTFGASASNVTPAGLYSATLSLIAVGTF